MHHGDVNLQVIILPLDKIGDAGTVPLAAHVMPSYP
jgi:hypothetical protein